MIGCILKLQQELASTSVKFWDKLLLAPLSSAPNVNQFWFWMNGRWIRACWLEIFIGSLHADDPDCIRGPQPADFPFQVMLGYTHVWITSFSKAKYSRFRLVTLYSVHVQCKYIEHAAPWGCQCRSRERKLHFWKLLPKLLEGRLIFSTFGNWHTDIYFFQLQHAIPKTFSAKPKS